MRMLHYFFFSNKIFVEDFFLKNYSKTGGKIKDQVIYKYDRLYIILYNTIFKSTRCLQQRKRDLFVDSKSGTSNFLPTTFSRKGTIEDLSICSE